MPSARSLTDFLRNHREGVERLRASDAPEILTINSRPELVVQSVHGYEATLERLDRAESVLGLWQAHAQLAASLNLKAGLARLRERHGL